MTPNQRRCNAQFVQSVSQIVNFVGPVMDRHPDPADPVRQISWTRESTVAVGSLLQKCTAEVHRAYTVHGAPEEQSKFIERVLIALLVVLNNVRQDVSVADYVIPTVIFASLQIMPDTLFPEDVPDARTET